MKYLVLGGGGFIGSAVCDQLLKDGHTIRVLERPRIPAYRAFEVNECVEWLEGDLLNTHDVSHAMEGVDGIVHLVSTTLPKSSNDDPVYDVQTNVVLSLNVLNCMKETGVSKIVFISSGGTVYGVPTQVPLDENHSTNPTVSYGVTKLAIEKYIYLYHKLYDINAIILRVSNPYGERQRIETSQGAVGVFLQRAVRGEVIEIWGDGSVVRDFIHVADVATAFSQALKIELGFGVFNIGSGVGTSIINLLDIIEDVIASRIQRHFLPSRSFDVPVNVLNIQRARDELAWEPAIELKNGLQRTYNWMNGRR